MKHYIALLRGINVGGKNKIPMSELKTVFTNLGFESVETYINSGNVLFYSDQVNPLIIKERIETSIKITFSLDIKIVVFRSVDLIETLETAPEFWGSHTSFRHNAIFLMEGITSKTVIDALGQLDGSVEHIQYANQIIFWSIKRDAYNKSRYAKLAGKPIYKSMTIRNSNTTKKLAQIAQKYISL